MKPFLQIPLSILVNLKPTTKDTKLRICRVSHFRIKVHGTGRCWATVLYWNE